MQVLGDDSADDLDESQSPLPTKSRPPRRKQQVLDDSDDDFQAGQGADTHAGAAYGGNAEQMDTEDSAPAIRAGAYSARLYP
jgi:hypothetical protein